MTALRTRVRVHNFWLGFAIFLVVGTLFVLIGYFFLTSNLELIKNGTATKATVIEIVEKTSSKSTAYYPVVEYLTSSGELIRIESSTGVMQNAYKPGDPINIIYKGSDPRSFILDRFFDKYGFR